MGQKIRGVQLERLFELKERASFTPSTELDQLELSLDTLPHEYPAYGNSDFRMPAFQVKLPNGTTVTDLRFDSHRIVDGKPRLLDCLQRILRTTRKRKRLKSR